MPARQFDRNRVRAVRRAKDLKQDDVAKSLAVSRAAVARWENGKDCPAADKLPALANALSEPLEKLFPRDGAPDLADLRADAGYNQSRASTIINASRAPLSNAERGIRRLDSDYVPLLADAYGVSTEELLAAQEVSFGNCAPPPPRLPQTLAEKITYLLENTYPDQEPPTDAEIAQGINAKAGSAIVTADDVKVLRTGTGTAGIDPEDPALLDGLSAVFAVSRMYFQPNEKVAGEVIEGIRFLTLIQQGKILGLAARGNDSGLSETMLAKINDLVAEIQRGEIPSTGPGGRPA
jgi:transcriptional regulator with XRE-family HTH domain